MVRKILVVEDNEKNRRLIRDILEYHGCEVREAADGASGIAAAREYLPDVILMDIQMPVMDGIEAARIIRQEPALKGIRMIAFTSFAMKGDHERFLAAGFDDYIAKPINTRTLPELVMHAPPERRSAGNEDAVFPRRNIRVLVVAGDRATVKAICDALGRKGYDAAPAYSGDEAIRLVRASAPDCLLMDVALPGTGGIEAARLIRNIAPDLPVVLMSGDATYTQEEEAVSKGACAVMAKPVDIGAVLAFLSVLRKEQRILVVDDDPLVGKTLTDLFTPRGVVVDAESDPRNALLHMEREYELAVLLGLKPGGAGGLDVLKNIRARYPTKPVVLLSSAGEDAGDAIRKGLQDGAYGSVRKPFASEQVLETIREIRIKKLRAVLGKRYELRPRES